MYLIIDAGYNNPIITLETRPINLVLSQDTVDITVVELGTQGPVGPIGLTGVGLEYDWQGTNLGIKQDNQQNFEYVNLLGPQGDNLDFNDLTEQQKIELRADVGDTNINYTNIFLASLLS